MPLSFLFRCLILLHLGGTLSLQAQDNCQLYTRNETVEQCQNPMGIIAKKPRFGWQLAAQCAFAEQRKYQILVASSPQLLDRLQADMWNSGSVSSSKQLNIFYQGKPLKSAQSYYWKVKLWQENGLEGPWGGIQQWTNGLKDSADLKASWIQANVEQDSVEGRARHAAHYFYHSFAWNSNKKVTKATCFVSGLGVYDLYIDGHRIGQQRMNPAHTDFDKRALYNCYDISNMLSGNKHAVGIAVGNGKLYNGRRHLNDYGLPRLWCQLHINFDDGTDTLIVSNTQWYSRFDGAVVFNNEYDGEQYDARKEFENWATWQQSIQAWSPSIIRKGFDPILSPQLMPALEIIETIAVKKIYKIAKDTLVYDFGQNTAGWAKLSIQGQEGLKVSLRYAEKIDSTHRLDTLSLRSAKAKDVFIKSGLEIAQYEPRFTYHGFRYVELSGKGLQADSVVLTAQVLHNQLAKKGSFQCSNPTLNRIYSLINWSLKSNYQQVPVDCPQREERLGWLGDRTASVYGEGYLYDIYHFYKKWLQDIQDAQVSSGQIPNVVPAYWKMNKDNVTWPVSYLHIVDVLSRHYGDYQLIKTHYASMQKWVDYIDQAYSYKGYIYVDQYGDWLIPPKNVNDKKNNNPKLKSSAEILASTAFAKALNLLLGFAHKLDKPKDIERYTLRLDQLKVALHTHLLDTTTLSYGTHSPSEIVLLLHSKLLNNEATKKLLKNLDNLLLGPYLQRTPFGMVGLRYLFRTLSNKQRTNLALAILTNKNYPSWGYMLDQGATTLWEKWNGHSKSSQNHIILSGDILYWFYAYLGGIRASKEAVAFDKIDLMPHIPDQIDSLRVSFQSPRGSVISHWKKHKKMIHWQVEIPLGTVANIYLPYSKKIHRQVAPLLLDTVVFCASQKYARFKIKAGRYELKYSLPKTAAAKLSSTPPLVSKIDTLSNKNQALRYRISIASPDPKACIYYTLDGTRPNSSSPLYTKPIIIEQYCNLQLVAQSKGQKISRIVQQAIQPYHPQKNGWHYRYYEINTRKLPLFDALVAKDSGQTAHIKLKQLKQRPHFWAFSFESFLFIQKEGLYRFYLDSDDGSRCIINQQTIVDNDGIHYSTQRQGMTYLKKGWHPIRLEHFNSWSFNSLELLISGPQLPKQPLPPSWLFYKKDP